MHVIESYLIGISFSLFRLCQICFELLLMTTEHPTAAASQKHSTGETRCGFYCEAATGKCNVFFSVVGVKCYQLSVSTKEDKVMVSIFCQQVIFTFCKG